MAKKSLARPLPGNDDGRFTNANGATLSVTNSTGSSYSLTGLLFDFGSVSASLGSELTSVSYTVYNGPFVTAGPVDLIATNKVTGANPGNPLQTIPSGFLVPFPPSGGGATANSTQDYSDFSADLGGFTLASGRTIVFTWNTTATAGREMRMDNIALLGAIVPDPSSLIVSVMGLGLIFLKRRR